MPDAILGSVLGAATSSLLGGGGGGSVSYTDPSQQIQPEHDYEAALRELLSQNALGFLSTGWGIQNLANDLLNPDVIKALYSQLLTQQQDISQGILPQSYQKNFEDSIRGTVEKTMGTTLNNLNSRGIINSSVATTANNDLQRNIAQAAAANYQNSLQNAASLAAMPLTTAISVPSTVSTLAQQHFEKPYNLYNLWRQTRYQNQATAMYQPTQPGFAQAIAPTLGKAIGDSISQGFNNAGSNNYSFSSPQGTYYTTPPNSPSLPPVPNYTQSALPPVPTQQYVYDDFSNFW